MEEEPQKHQSLLPGPATDVSVGIAIGHERDPLQRIVQAAQICEKKAKSELGRSALFAQVVKRSGEIIEWGCKWESHGLELLNSLLAEMINGKLAARFPYKVIELLDPYLPAEGTTLDDDQGFEDSAISIVQRELQDSIISHWQGPRDEAITLSGEVSERLEKYWVSMTEIGASAVQKVHNITDLARTLAWSV